MALAKPFLRGHLLAFREEVAGGFYREIWRMTRVLIIFDIGAANRPASCHEFRLLAHEMRAWADCINRPGRFSWMSNERPRTVITRMPDGTEMVTVVMQAEVCFWFSDPQVAFEFKMRWG